MAMPPRPPRFPPAYVGRASWLTGLNVFVTVLNLHSAYAFAQDAAWRWVFVACLFAVLSVCSSYVVARQIYKDMKEWRALLRAYDELDAFMRSREGRK